MIKGTAKLFLKTGLYLLLTGILICPSAEGQFASQSQNLRASLAAAKAKQISKIVYSPVHLRNGSTLTLIAPIVWNPLREQLESTLKLNHRNFEKLFGGIPPFSTSVRLMDEDLFFLKTGAPRWTNAMYFKNEITIPLSRKKAIDFSTIFRAVKHEHTHAILHSLSGGRCPGWLDEGLAQWAEGQENPALRPALRKWLTKNRPVPLNLLQGGFTRLQTKMVPAAYAQSLFAAKIMINTYGFPVIRRYLDLLKKGKKTSNAFQTAFQISEKNFEKRLGATLRNWASGN